MILEADIECDVSGVHLVDVCLYKLVGVDIMDSELSFRHFFTKGKLCNT